jgi:hypothetical protein
MLVTPPSSGAMPPCSICLALAVAPLIECGVHVTRVCCIIVRSCAFIIISPPSHAYVVRCRQSETDPDEITVDLDEVDPATIRFLIQIVDEALAARKRKQSRASDEQEA